ncbi:hypothetical protein M3Y99_01218600 [Aphelenchoides fujianensis]|nr:hypothetical protein M3Y99_01218600 [Aphelenchoides fujianensis]
MRSTLFALNVNGEPRRSVGQFSLPSPAPTPTSVHSAFPAQMGGSHEEVLEADNRLVTYLVCWFFSYFSQMGIVLVVWYAAIDPLHSNVNFYFAIVPVVSFCFIWITFPLLLYLELMRESKEWAASGWRAPPSSAEVGGLPIAHEDAAAALPPSVSLQKTFSAFEKVFTFVYLVLNGMVVGLHVMIGTGILVYAACFTNRSFALHSALAADMTRGSLIAIGVAYFLPTFFVFVQMRIFAKRHRIFKK